MPPANPVPPVRQLPPVRKLPPLPNATASYLTNFLSVCCLPRKLSLSPCHISVRRSFFFAKATGGEEILSNALLRRTNPSWGGGCFSLGVDLGTSHTGLALGKGFCPRPLTVLNLRGQKLETRLLKIAEQEEVDEFIIGLPKSIDGKETLQSNKVRSIAGRVAVQAAERGWRVYLQDEYGTTLEALDVMRERGLKRSARQGKIDSYSALMLLERYFSTSGTGAELVLPKQLDLQEKVRRCAYRDKRNF